MVKTPVTISKFFLSEEEESFFSRRQMRFDYGINHPTLYGFSRLPSDKIMYYYHYYENGDMLTSEQLSPRSLYTSCCIELHK